MDPDDVLPDDLPPDARALIDEAEQELRALRGAAEQRAQEIRDQAEQEAAEVEAEARDAARQREQALAAALKPIQDRHAKAGRLDEALAVRAQIRRLRAAGQGVRPAPYSVADLGEQSLGAQMLFRLTGDLDGAVWGSDVYTHDSCLATAAVHAGALGPGEQGVVRVT